MSRFTWLAAVTSLTIVTLFVTACSSDNRTSRNSATGNTFVCSASNAWVPVAPLLGVRPMRAPCDEKVPGTAQTPAGPLVNCEGQAWTAYNDVLYLGAMGRHGPLRRRPVIGAVDFDHWTA